MSKSADPDDPRGGSVPTSYEPPAARVAAKSSLAVAASGSSVLSGCFGSAWGLLRSWGPCWQLCWRCPCCSDTTCYVRRGCCGECLSGCKVPPADHCCSPCCTCCRCCECCDLRRTVCFTAFLQFFLGGSLGASYTAILLIFLRLDETVVNEQLYLGLLLYLVAYWWAYCLSGVSGCCVALDKQGILTYAPRIVFMARLYLWLTVLASLGHLGIVVLAAGLWQTTLTTANVLISFVPLLWDWYIVYLAWSLVVKLKEQRKGIFRGKPVMGNQRKPQHLLELHTGHHLALRPPPAQIIAPLDVHRAGATGARWSAPSEVTRHAYAVSYSHTPYGDSIPLPPAAMRHSMPPGFGLAPGDEMSPRWGTCDSSFGGSTESMPPRTDSGGAGGGVGGGAGGGGGDHEHGGGVEGGSDYAIPVHDEDGAPVLLPLPHQQMLLQRQQQRLPLPPLPPPGQQQQHPAKFSVPLLLPPPGVGGVAGAAAPSLALAVPLQRLHAGGGSTLTASDALVAIQEEDPSPQEACHHPLPPPHGPSDTFQGGQQVPPTNLLAPSAVRQALPPPPPPSLLPYRPPAAASLPSAAPSLAGGHDDDVDDTTLQFRTSWTRDSAQHAQRAQQQHHPQQHQPQVQLYPLVLANQRQPQHSTAEDRPSNMTARVTGADAVPSPPHCSAVFQLRMLSTAVPATSMAAAATGGVGVTPRQLPSAAGGRRRRLSSVLGGAGMGGIAGSSGGGAGNASSGSGGASGRGTSVAHARPHNPPLPRMEPLKLSVPVGAMYGPALYARANRDGFAGVGAGGGVGAAGQAGVGAGVLGGGNQAGSTVYGGADSAYGSAGGYVNGGEQRPSPQLLKSASWGTTATGAGPPDSAAGVAGLRVAGAVGGILSPSPSLGRRAAFLRQMSVQRARAVQGPTPQVGPHERTTHSFAATATNLATKASNPWDRPAAVGAIAQSQLPAGQQPQAAALPMKPQHHTSQQQQQQQFAPPGRPWLLPPPPMGGPTGLPQPQPPAQRMQSTVESTVPDPDGPSPIGSEDGGPLAGEGDNRPGLNRRGSGGGAGVRRLVRAVSSANSRLARGLWSWTTAASGVEGSLTDSVTAPQFPATPRRPPQPVGASARAAGALGEFVAPRAQSYTGNVTAAAGGGGGSKSRLQGRGLDAGSVTTAAASAGVRPARPPPSVTFAPDVPVSEGSTPTGPPPSQAAYVQPSPRTPRSRFMPAAGTGGPWAGAGTVTGTHHASTDISGPFVGQMHRGPVGRGGGPTAPVPRTSEPELGPANTPNASRRQLMTQNSISAAIGTAVMGFGAGLAGWINGGGSGGGAATPDYAGAASSVVGRKVGGIAGGGPEPATKPMSGPEPPAQSLPQPQPHPRQRQSFWWPQGPHGPAQGQEETRGQQPPGASNTPEEDRNGGGGDGGAAAAATAAGASSRPAVSASTTFASLLAPLQLPSVAAVAREGAAALYGKYYVPLTGRAAGRGGSNAYEPPAAESSRQRAPWEGEAEEEVGFQSKQQQQQQVTGTSSGSHRAAPQRGGGPPRQPPAAEILPFEEESEG